ncbi:MarR family transcriptional regulator [Erythrobacter litoralis]|uniref:MarR family winged helix-turn-helix transcriptional regulator n=1 Tax=Erythrobacter litoralis TaxID=39960 RepID=UPI00243576E4|nr:MarR family transcriptional regulator [Erythrobacter litoralis]MDG6080273.1 MarR family transcriptional regulator [Erythrobacter litoralis]
MNTSANTLIGGRTALGNALTALVLDIFRLNGELLSTGDALVQDLGLTSARWQVLGAIARSPMPAPVAHLARAMGLTRQAVQRVVDDLRAAGFVRLETNPNHQRAMLVVMTDQGADTYRRASERQLRWVEQLASGLSPDAVETAADLVKTLRQRLSPPEASEE